MHSANSAFKSFFNQLTSAEVLVELIVIVVAVALALAGGHALKAWRRRRAEPASEAVVQNTVLEGAVILAPIFLALVLLLIARALLAAASTPTGVVDLALQ